MQKALQRVSVVLIAAFLGFLAAISFQHKCTRGLKWLEVSLNWLLPISFAIAPIFLKRLWLGIAIAIVLFLVVTLVLAPVYLSAVHPGGMEG